MWKVGWKTPIVKKKLINVNCIDILGVKIAVIAFVFELGASYVFVNAILIRHLYTLGSLLLRGSFYFIYSL